MINKMQTYKSHKRVKAGFISKVSYSLSSNEYTVITRDVIIKMNKIIALGMCAVPTIVDESWVKKFRPIPGEFIVSYRDGYLSTSPQDKFIERYDRFYNDENLFGQMGFGEFVSNKTVRAMKVGLIEGCRIYDYDDENFFIDVSPEYISKYSLNLPGYLLVYDNEHMSWYPEDSFIRDHKLI